MMPINKRWNYIIFEKKDNFHDFFLHMKMWLRPIRGWLAKARLSPERDLKARQTNKQAYSYEPPFLPRSGIEPGTSGNSDIAMTITPLAHGLSYTIIAFRNFHKLFRPISPKRNILESFLPHRVFFTETGKVDFIVKYTIVPIMYIFLCSLQHSTYGFDSHANFLFWLPGRTQIFCCLVQVVIEILVTAIK